MERSKYFEEGLKMEQRCIEAAKSIILSYPGAMNIEFYCGKGKRTEPSIDGIYDVLGIDCSISLINNSEILKGQIKIGSHKNFLEYGKERKSFVLGRYNDIIWEQIDLSIKMVDFLLTGYEVGETGVIQPYALICWPLFLKRVFEDQYRRNYRKNHGKVLYGSSIQIHRERNHVDNSLFGYVTYTDLAQSNAAIFMNVKAFED